MEKHMSSWKFLLTIGLVGSAFVIWGYVFMWVNYWGM